MQKKTLVKKNKSLSKEIKTFPNKHKSIPKEIPALVNKNTRIPKLMTALVNKPKSLFNIMTAFINKHQSIPKEMAAIFNGFEEGQKKSPVRGVMFVAKDTPHFLVLAGFDRQNQKQSGGIIAYCSANPDIFGISMELK